MPTVPARSALVSRIARLRSLVHTVAARPYSVSLAIRTASSSSLKGITDRTGPKISSRAMLMSLDTSVNRVGATKLPAARSPSPRVPPQTSRAPAAWPSAISPITRSTCRALISGDDVTAGSNGLP